MSKEYYILQPNGDRDGPYAEEEVLDLLEGGALHPAAQCLDAATGRVCDAVAMFQVIDPAAEAVVPRAPVPWQPAPFPEIGGDAEESGRSDLPGSRILYRGNPCVLTYWRSVLLAAASVAAGWLAREKWPGMLAVGLIAGSLVILRAILHRLGTQFSITSARVEVIEGLVSRSSRELRIPDIRAINVRCTGLTGLLGVGTLNFSSAAGAQDDVVFRNVWSAATLKNMVRRLQDGGG